MVGEREEAKKAYLGINFQGGFHNRIKGFLRQKGIMAHHHDVDRCTITLFKARSFVVIEDRGLLPENPFLERRGKIDFKVKDEFYIR